jgi:hypothetical protein
LNTNSDDGMTMKSITSLTVATGLDPPCGAAAFGRAAGAGAGAGFGACAARLTASSDVDDINKRNVRMPDIVRASTANQF